MSYDCWPLVYILVKCLFESFADLFIGLSVFLIELKEFFISAYKPFVIIYA